MLKQIIIRNLYNFKDEIILDFTTSNELVAAHQFNKDIISNFALIYGKNNIGKSNLLRAVKESFQFLLKGQMNLSPFEPTISKVNSLFEMIIEDEENEIRYGFEININNKIVIDEWMYSKVNRSSRETKLFLRSEKFAHKDYFIASERRLIEKVNGYTLLLTMFETTMKKNKLVLQMLDSLKSSVFITCFEDPSDDDILSQIIEINQDPKLKNVFDAFILNADLDIKEVSVSQLNQEENDLFTKIDFVYKNIDKSIEAKKYMGLFVDEQSKMHYEVKHNMIVTKTDSGSNETYRIGFVHNSNMIFGYDELSSGTKQILRIVSIVISNLYDNSVFFIDGIEADLHPDLVELLIHFFEMVVTTLPKNQFIITSHRDELLDIENISSQCKIFLKNTGTIGKIDVTYLSNYKLRDYQSPSKRYKLDAFETNPRIIYEYQLLGSVEDLDLEDTFKQDIQEDKDK